MQITLIDFTGKGHNFPARYAAAKLIFTKSTRLNMSPDGFDGIMDRCLSLGGDAWMDEQLEAMARTLPSSWEFVNYTFCIEKVTRAFTHQLVRTRTASYAQQAMRVVDMSEGFTYETPPAIEDDYLAREEYKGTMGAIQGAYARMVDIGMKTEDARGILPTNIHTNIVMSANLRTMADVIRKRSSGRVQGEYRTFVEMSAKLITGVHPWAAKFIEDRTTAYARELDELLDGAGISPQRNNDVYQQAWKLVDKLRGADR